MHKCPGISRCPTIGQSVSPQGGFTLLELLVVLVLMLVIAGVVMPQFSRSLSIFQLQKSTRQTAAVLNEARNKAITEAREVIFELDSEKRTYTWTAAKRPYVWPEGIEIGFESMDGYLSIDSISEIVFHPDGSASGARLAVSTAENSYFIVVDWITGQVNVHK